MQFAVYGKSLSVEALTYLDQLIGKLRASDCGILFYEPFYRGIKDALHSGGSFKLFSPEDDIRNKVDILISIGGDGTLLDTITLVRDSGIPVLGVNMGRLGFLSSLSREDMMQGIDRILSKDYLLDSRILLRLESKQGLFGDRNYALNDLALTRKGNFRMITVHAYIDGKFLNSYLGDGLIISTPTGSTAYSLSCGGPIINPGSENLVITPIATHNLTVRPVVISDHSIITLKIQDPSDEFIVSLDSRSETMQGSIELTVRKADFCINLLRFEGQDFFKTIRAKLNWGLDIRN